MENINRRHIFWDNCGPCFWLQVSTVQLVTGFPEIYVPVGSVEDGGIVTYLSWMNKMNNMSLYAILLLLTQWLLFWNATYKVTATLHCDWGIEVLLSISSQLTKEPSWIQFQKRSFGESTGNVTSSFSIQFPIWRHKSGINTAMIFWFAPFARYVCIKSKI